MRKRNRSAIVPVSCFLLVVCCVWASGDTPFGRIWWPSEFGPDDQRGAINRQTPEHVAKAAGMIKEGKIYQLGRVYEQGMPLAGKRHYSLTIPGSPSSPPDGKNRIVSHDEMFSGEIGQVGTQFDGLGHVGARLDDGEDYFYNGFKRSEFGDAYGLKKLGVENVGVFFTRGVLLDVAAYKGVRRLNVGDVITGDDLAGTAKLQNVQIHEGDAVFLHTGHGQLWMVDNKTYAEGEPGIDISGGRWLADHKIVLIGADSWAIEVVPSVDKERPYEVHQWDLTYNGIYHLENLDLTELANDKVYEFAFIFSPLRLKGATGSPGNPIAVK